MPVVCRPSCLVTDVIKASEEMVSLLPGSCREDLGHLLDGLLRFWPLVLSQGLRLCCCATATYGKLYPLM